MVECVWGWIDIENGCLIACVKQFDMRWFLSIVLIVYVCVILFGHKSWHRGRIVYRWSIEFEPCWSQSQLILEIELIIGVKSLWLALLVSKLVLILELNVLGRMTSLKMNSYWTDSSHKIHWNGEIKFNLCSFCFYCDFECDGESTLNVYIRIKMLNVELYGVLEFDVYVGRLRCVGRTWILIAKSWMLISNKDSLWVNCLGCRTDFKRTVILMCGLKNSTCKNWKLFSTSR